MKFAPKMMLCGLAGTLLFLAGHGDAADKKNPATTPQNRDIARHKGFVEYAQSEGSKIEVVMLGDSITQGWGGRPTMDKTGKVVPTKGVSKAWAKLEEFTKPANFGIGGDQTGHVLWRLTEGKEFDNIKPKAVVLMIGTNNSGRDSAEQIADGITLIVKTIHQKAPSAKVLLLGVFPRGEKTTVLVKKDDKKVEVPNPARVKLSKVNEIISKLDDGGKTVKYLDIGDKFMQKDGTITKDIMPDFLHLSAKGYDIWAEAITPALKELLK